MQDMNVVHKPMTREEALKILNLTEDKLATEKIMEVKLHVNCLIKNRAIISYLI